MTRDAAPEIIETVPDGGPVVVVDEQLLFSARFVADGADLRLVGDDREVLIRDYFADATPPDLTDPMGGFVSGETVLSFTVSDTQLAQAAAPIGSVETVKGEVAVLRSDGSREILGQGDPIYQGDEIRTAEEAGVGIVFEDDTTVSLGGGGQLVMDALVYDPATQTGEAAFNLVEGVFTFVSGQIAKTQVDAMVINTPAATIGIRGTAGFVGSDPNDGVTAGLMPESDGSGGTFAGELTFSNSAGTITLNQPFQATQAASFDASPRQAFTVSSRDIGRDFGDALESLPNAERHLPQEFRQTTSEAHQEAQAEQAAAEAEGEPQPGEGEVPPEGAPQPGEGLPGEELPPGAEAQLEQALLEGTLPQEALDAAAQAALEAALAQGATPEQAAAAAAAAQEAFAAALAAGLSPQEAMQAAMAAASSAAQDAEVAEEAPPEGEQNLEAAANVPLADGGGEGTGEGGDGSAIEAAAQDAFTEGLADGAGLQQVFDSAMQAAIDQAIAEGVSPEEAARVAAEVEQAFQDALAAGMTPEQAMASAMASVDGGGEPDPDPETQVAENGGGGEGGAADTGGTIQESTPDRIARVTSEDDGPGGFDIGGFEGIQRLVAEDFGFGDEILFEARIAVFDDFDEDPSEEDRRPEDTVNAIVAETETRIVGSPDGDRIVGTPANDLISGREGNDFIYGDKPEELVGGVFFNQTSAVTSPTFSTDPADYGNDAIAGGAGNDSIWGGGGNDVIHGDVPDISAAEEELKNLSGILGADIVGNDYIDGGEGNDQIDGGGGDDTLLGGAGTDTLNGEEGADQLYGGADADKLFGGVGVDTLTGGGGADTLEGGKGNDSLVGGAGDDVYVYDFESDDHSLGTDTITDSTTSDGDALSINSSGVAYELRSVTENANDVTLTFVDRTGTGADTAIVLDGQMDSSSAGVEVMNFEGTTFNLPGSAAVTGSLNGGSGNDVLYGSTGGDTLSGSTGADLMFGNDGVDTLFGGGGVDYLYGGAGNDSLDGGSGGDVFTGGDGADNLDMGLSDGAADVIRYLTNTSSYFGDNVTNFEIANDKFQFDGDAFGFGSTTGTLSSSWFTTSAGTPNASSDDSLAASPGFIFDTSNERLYYDSDGSAGSASYTLVASFSSDTAFTNANIELI